MLIVLHCVTQPPPFPRSYLLVNGNLISSGPHILVCDPVWPENTQDLSETFVNNGLQSCSEFLCHEPGFTAIEKDRFNIRVEDLPFGLPANDL